MRRKNKRIAVPNALIAVFLLAAPLTAYAYIDLGTGSFIVQAALASVFAAAFAVKTHWRRIKKLFRVETEPPGDEPQT